MIDGTSEDGDPGLETSTDGAIRGPSDAGVPAADAQVGEGSVVATGDGGPRSAESVWAPLSVMALVNPMDYGAKGNGTSDDLAAISAAVNALPATGGIVYFPPSRTYRKNNVLLVTKSHVKFWGGNRRAEIFQSVAGQPRHQSILCRNNTGCGVFGLKLRSDASERFDALEDNQISADHSTLVEVAGVEIQGSAAAGIFLYGSTEHYIEGNYVHHTWADHIHHTSGATASWVWNNTIFNEAPSRGDDGIACVTYGAESARCRDMEWWRNSILHTDWGRGYSVIGGNDIAIHHNWAIGVAGAGVIVASEDAYDSAASQRISIANNYVYQCGHAIAHPGILVSGASEAAGPLRDIAINTNVSVGTPGGDYRAEGSYVNVTNTNLANTMGALPQPMPTRTMMSLADTTVLRTRDVSHVPAASRPGLYRIHVRQAASGSGFQQRFEYVVKGAPAALATFVQARSSAGDYLVEQRTLDGTAYALVLCAAPVALSSGLSAVTFRDLRAKDQPEALGWLWQRTDIGSY